MTTTENGDNENKNNEKAVKHKVFLEEQHDDDVDEERSNVRRRQWNGRSHSLSTKLSTVACVSNEDPENAVGTDDLIVAQPHTTEEEDEIEKKENRVVTETMTENVFSLIFTAPLNSSAFWLGILVSLFQILMPSLALLDLIVFSDDKNPLQVPNSVSLQVRIIGGMALILAVSQYWDFMEAIDKLEHGPPPRSQHTPIGATFCKFYLAYTMQFMMGTLFIITIFTLVVQSTTVVGMFLNFAALEFITTVDDVAFALGKRGYFTNSIKKACDEVNEMVVLRKKGGRVSRRIQILIITASVLGMFGVIILQEERGQFDCRRIEVQFGDGFITMMPVFSGIYTYQREFYDGRPTYMDERKRAVFRYCANGDGGIFSFAESGYWVFNVRDNESTPIEDMCTNYISRSPNTKGYDILEQPGNTWLAKHRLTDSVEYLTDYFSLRCADCDPSTCNGQCVNDTCVCGEDGRFGSHCQFTEPPCEETDYDRRTSPFSGAGNTYSSDYYLMRNSRDEVAFSYNRPIYSYAIGDDEVDILMNLGRRYFMFYLTPSMIDGIQNVSEDGALLADYLENVHPYYDWIEPELASGQNGTTPFHIPVFVSDPIDIGTATDNVSPLGLSWARVNRVELNEENYFDIFLRGGNIDTVLLCAACSKISPCLNGGVCNENSACQCTFGGTGRLCEKDCYEVPESKYCPRCFADYLTDSSCELQCYGDSNASDCPDCRNNPNDGGCIDCFQNYTAPGCKGEGRGGRLTL